MKDRMIKWAVVFSLLSCAFLFSIPRAYSSSYHTGHFTIDFPWYWEPEFEDSLMRFISMPSVINKDDVGSYIVNEIEIHGAQYTDEELYDFILSGLSSDQETYDVNMSSISIDGIDSRLMTCYRWMNGSNKRTYVVLCRSGSYILMVVYYDYYGVGDQSDVIFRQRLDTINTTPDQPKDDEERFTYAAHQVFGDSLFSSRAGKYPTVEIKTDCSDWSARKDIYKKTILFLEKVKGLRDEFGFDFPDIRINVYADVMDVYGNTDFMNILGFNISAEDIDKINYKKIPSENVPKIAFNWFDLKLLP